jgi:hypothetical protein
MGMDDFERATQFRNAVVEQRVGWSYGDQEPENFFFDLNSGQIYTKRDAESAMKVVQLAREAAADEGYGDHNALLSLVAERSELGRNSVYWHRPYHVRASDDPEVWISLKDWLKEQGQNPDSVYSAE